MSDGIGLCVTACLHISAVTWCEQPQDQMASRPVVQAELPLSGKILQPDQGLAYAGLKSSSPSTC